MKKNNVISRLMIVIIVAKFIGLLREIVLANYYGTSNVSDAYIIASTVPTLLFYFIGQSISTAYIPMYNKIKYSLNEKDAVKYSNNLLNISILVSLVIIIFLMLFPNMVVKIFASGFDNDTTLLTARLIKISSFSLLFMCTVSIFSAYLQANDSFLPAASVSIPRNIIIIGSIVLSVKYGVWLMGVGLLLSYFFEFILLIPFVIKKKYKYTIYVSYHNKYLKETIYIIGPIMLGLCVSQLNKIIDRFIASNITVGAISALSYAAVINTAVQEVLVTGIITVLFSNCSKLVAQKKYDEVKSKLSKTIDVMIFILIPATMAIMLLAKMIVKVLLSRGTFDSHSIMMTTGALIFYTLGLCFLAIRDTLVKVYYAYEDTATPTKYSIISIVINIVLNIIFSKLIGIKGLALATSISSMFNCIVLYVLLRRKIGDFGFKGMFKGIIKSLFSSLLMIVILYFINMYFMINLGDIIRIMLLSIIGFIIYIIINLLFNNEILLSFINNNFNISFKK